MNRRWAAIAVAAVVLVAWGATSAWALTGAAPVPGPVVRGFDPPSEDWLPGHRGVDLLAPPGTEVVAAAAGAVTFAGPLAGRDVIVVDHGELRTTYEPASPLVRVGDQVAAGQPIGRLDAGHSCPGGTCLHWGLKRGEEYLDPLSMLAAGDVRLLPSTSADIARAAVRARARAFDAGTGLPGVLGKPANGPVTSPFGDRLHPIDNVWRSHDGIDIGAACDTPIRAPAPGRVATVDYGEDTGHRLVLDHGVVGGRRLRTIYLHATGYRVSPGQRVTRGETLGKVGTTGLSTGCHLHFSVTLDGTYIDPASFG